MKSAIRSDVTEHELREQQSIVDAIEYATENDLGHVSGGSGRPNWSAP